MAKPNLEYYTFQQAADHLSKALNENYDSDYIYGLARDNYLITCFKSLQQDKYRYISAHEVESIKSDPSQTHEPSSYDNPHDAFIFRYDEEDINLDDIGWEPVKFDDLLISHDILSTFIEAQQINKENIRHNFEKAYWNLIQLYAWVRYRDMELVSTAADNCSLLRLVLYASYDKKPTLLDETQTDNQIISKLQSGNLIALGVPNNEGDQKEIGQNYWADLKFFYDPDIAAPSDFMLRRDATIWHNLKFKQEDILKIWPLIECKDATIPPENISDNNLKAFLLHDTLKEYEAIYLLNGKNPRTTPNWDEDLFTHFPTEKSYLNRSVQSGRFGDAKMIDGQPHYIATPKDWANWFLEKHLLIEERAAKLLGLPKNKNQTYSKANAEKECEIWLTELLKKGKQEKNKDQYLSEALKKFPGISERGFRDRAWPNAMNESGNPHHWGKPGPKKK